MQKLFGLCSELFPLCRSITGDGVRQTLAMIGTHVPLVVREVPSGTPIFDWTVPNEWNIRAAWINDARGSPLRLASPPATALLARVR